MTAFLASIFTLVPLTLAISVILMPIGADIDNATGDTDVWLSFGMLIFTVLFPK